MQISILGKKVKKIKKCFLSLFLALLCPLHAFALHDAARRGDIETLRWFLSINTKGDVWSTLGVEFQNGHGNEVLALMLSATKKGDISYLISALDLNAQKDGLSPLMIASHCGHTGAVRVLLDAKADINVKSQRGGWTALMLAAMNKRVKVLELLLRSKADVHTKTARGWTALLFAAQSGLARNVRSLLDAKANIQTTTRDGLTAIIIASAHGHNAVLRELLAHEPKPCMKGHFNSRNALMHATENDHLVAVKLLLSEDPEMIHEMDANGQTAPMIAIGNGCNEILQVLLEARADINGAIPECSLIRCASEQHNWSALKMLKEWSIESQVRPSKDDMDLLEKNSLGSQTDYSFQFIARGDLLRAHRKNTAEAIQIPDGPLSIIFEYLSMASRQRDSSVCDVCQEPDDLVAFLCLHSICKRCAKKTKFLRRLKCPFCLSNMVKKD